MAKTHSKSASHHHQVARGDSDGQEEGKKECHTKPLPPKGFIPLKASEEERLSYGFPRRPDPATHPKQYQVWERILAVPMEIQPQVPGKPVELHIPEKEGATAAIKPLLQPLPRGPGTPFWGTAASVYQSFQGCYNVHASWVVPAIGVPVNPQGNGPWGLSCVVQLDSALVGGTTSWIQYDDDAHTQISSGAYAWTTFLSRQIEFSKYNFFNLAVKQGDIVTCAVCTESSKAGFCNMANQSTKQSAVLPVSQPTLLDVLTGTSAAWGVIIGAEDEKVPFSNRPPIFNVISMYDCGSASPAASLGLMPGEVISNLLAPAGSPGPNPIWKTLVLTPSVLWVIDEATA
ncbi:hypothetical protein GP486_004855 [Trichoglossum hirsutum]|uniref:Uncharacterized protein n=1 Tax=Trichoglossum hirsutum TaxID=265104 RepID=A0A9P8RNW6_9PEZI|nr:hypothetical protein GP486_004855 [Trichoglossum hirsutum]